VEDGERREMRFRQTAVIFAAVFALGAAHTAFGAQNAPADAAKPHAAKSDQTSRVTIEVSGGADETPIENASVYVKYIEERKVLKDKKLELNVKTNREGAAHIPGAPMGRVLIQVVADGWKTYGRWYDITEAKQIFKVHLEKPPKWY
jgi:hypothetical protein